MEKNYLFRKITDLKREENEFLKEWIYNSELLRKNQWNIEKNWWISNENLQFIVEIKEYWGKSMNYWRKLMNYRGIY